MSRFLLIGVIAALLLLAVPVSAAPGERLGRAADAVVDAGVPGVAVYVRDRGPHDGRHPRIRRLAAKRPMSVADRFRIGSVTKSFVATIVLQLVNEGKLSLDDSVEQWLPGVVPNGSAITIRHLLSHQERPVRLRASTSKSWRRICMGISTTSGRRSRSSGWRPSTSPCLRRAPPGSRATRTRATSCSGW